MLERIFVRIYQAARPASQSGQRNNKIWKIRFANDKSKYIYNLMSWSGSSDTKQQLNLNFPSQEAAVSFAQNNNWNYEIVTPHAKKIILKSYADNFK